MSERSPITARDLPKQQETIGEKVLSWSAALVLLALWLLFPRWVLVYAFIVACVYVFYPGTHETDPDDFALVVKACSWGIALLALEAIFWWLFQIKSDVSLRETLIPTGDSHVDVRFAVAGWGLIFVAILHGTRWIFRTAFPRLD